MQTLMYFFASATRASNLRRFSARCSLLMCSTSSLRISKLKASSPFNTGVSLIGLAIIMRIKMNIRVQRYKKYCNYAPIRKKIFLKGRILRSFEVLMPHQSGRRPLPRHRQHHAALRPSAAPVGSPTQNGFRRGCAAAVSADKISRVRALCDHRVADEADISLATYLL